jgi:hypothetical protein
VLDSPASEDEIYLARAGEVDPYRPICQGDIFGNVEIPGLAGRTRAMVLSHPCAMRAGPRLRARVTVAPVSDHQNIPLAEWSTGHLRLMPLPVLDLEQPGQAHAAKLEEPMTIASSNLALEDRLATLSNRGIVLLEQRYIHNHSRASIPLELLYEVSAAVLEELELQESWNLALVRPGVEGGGDLTALLEQEAEAFDQVMLSAHEDTRSLRELLQTSSERASVRRIVSRAIAERVG